MKTVSDINTAAMAALWQHYDLQLSIVDDNNDIPGSYWGNPEAGLIKSNLYVRNDTPLHSMLHEGCHFICMDDERRANLDTDAGGEYAEEDAVCYLQLLLAEQLPNYSKSACMSDMDAWGYTFRLGSTRRWFYEDAEDAHNWLAEKKLLPDELMHLCKS